jgi:hypothetical protein
MTCAARRPGSRESANAPLTPRRRLEVGDHPDEYQRRMRWALATVQRFTSRRWSWHPDHPPPHGGLQPCRYNHPPSLAMRMASRRLRAPVLRMIDDM